MTTKKSESEQFIARGADRHTFVELLHELQESLDAIRELHEVITPHAADIDRRRTSAEFVAQEAKLSDATREQFIRFVENLKERAGALEHNAIKRAPSSDTHDAAGPTGDGRAAGIVFEDEVKRLLDIFRDSDGDKANIFMHFQRLSMSPSRASVLRSSLLTAAIGAFEALFAGIAHNYYRAYPGSLAAKKEFSLDDLKAFATIEDARDALVFARVDDLLRESFDSWLQWYDDAFKLKSQTYCIDHAKTVEAFQRRHIVVHNAGRVSQRYLEKIPPNADRPPLGSRPQLTQQYLNDVLDELDCLGNLLLVGAWSKVVPGEEAIAMAHLHLRSYQLMRAARWRPVKRICGIAKKIKVAEVNRVINQCNEWLAIKRISGVKAISSDVAAWDVSALDPGFHLVQLALLDDLDRLFALLPNLKSAMVTRTSLAEWPVLLEARADRRFAEYIAVLDGDPTPDAQGAVTANVTTMSNPDTTFRPTQRESTATEDETTEVVSTSDTSDDQVP